MAWDDLSEIEQARAERLRAYREAAKLKSVAEAARRHGLVASTLRSHENGNRTIGADDAELYAEKFSRPGRKITGRDIMYGPPENASDPSESGVLHVPVMGMIGAGALIEPKFEQIPPDGLHQVELKIPVPEDIIAFQVEGESMMPRYEDGDVILVWRDQKRALESFYGEEAAVLTTDGRRYLKTILYGKSRAVVNLHSLNAKMIEGVRLQWIGEVYSTIRSHQINRIEKRSRRAKQVGRSATKGT